MQTIMGLAFAPNHGAIPIGELLEDGQAECIPQMITVMVSHGRVRHGSDHHQRGGRGGWAELRGEGVPVEDGVPDGAGSAFWK